MRRKDREVTDKQGIEDIIRMCRICHVAMVTDGIPYVVPLSFGYKFLADGSLELYFHSAREGKKLDCLRKNNRVCFEITWEGEVVIEENLCRSGCYFASVIGNGEVIFIEDAVEKCEALSCLFYHQSGKEVVFGDEQAASVCVFKIVSKDFTGKRKLGDSKMRLPFITHTS